ncbi:hypothetical protein B5M09_002383 [Aphanomyces astaci]|uniref:Uncharacterized protein n=1 Tax=Aphanomyces astaci TaxID=112090 RepID=A0A3R7X3T3_APHAT|nr:hypothetical protein B5M09_002383 [Aphanomyces astaci]
MKVMTLQESRQRVAALPATPATPSTFKAATEMRYVAFRPLEEPEIVGSDAKLAKFYAPCSGFWLRIENFARVKAAQALSKSRTYLSISAYQHEDHDMTFSDMVALNEDANIDEEAKGDGCEDVSANDAIDSSSDDDMEEYVDRAWKKAEVLDVRDVEGLENVRWEQGLQVQGPTDLFVHANHAASHDQTIILPQHEDLFVDPVKDTPQHM